MPRLFKVRLRRQLGGVFGVLPDVQKRMQNPVRPIGRFLADRVMREGPGGVAHHFSRQAELPLRGGAIPWVQSQRAIRDGGLTLVDTGDLRRGWRGGAGSVTKVSKFSVLIGVDRARLPYASVFQDIGATQVGSTRGGGSVVPRRIVVSKGMVERFEEKVLDYLVRGER